MGSATRSSSSDLRTIGVISDTHGLLRPQAWSALAGVDHIIHAGDIGTPQIIEQLRLIAPVTAVRGNNDKGAWAEPIPPTAIVEIAQRRLYVLHDIADLDVDPRIDGFAAVIAGHSHKSAITCNDGVLFVNPGSAGPRRFKLPIAIAKLYISPTTVRAEIHELAVGSPEQRTQ
jgi:uncharacterized protein